MTHPAHPERRRILVIDDTEAIHADFRKTLEPQAASESFVAAKSAFLGGAGKTRKSKAPLFAVDCAHQGQDGVRMVEAAKNAGDPYLVAFVDMRMPPGWDGVTTIKHLWAVDPDVHVVICTAFSDDSLDAIAEELGRSDQLLILKKPFDTVEVAQLAAALSEKHLAQRAARSRMDDLEQSVRERTAEIEHAMLHDKLTGLPNRALLLNRLDACLERQRRDPQRRFAVLFLDFDRFKMVNDSLGHEVGDLMLIEVAERLRSTLRGSDAICNAHVPSRLGGDEFIVLLEDLRENNDAARVAQRLLDAVAEPYLINDHQLHLTASIGIAASDRDYDKSGTMIRDADTAMYRAKAAGRARYVMFDQEMHREATQRLTLEGAMRSAVRNDEMVLHYQPMVRLSDGRLSGLEALVRWKHPELGSIGAAALIGVAEEIGLIQTLSFNLLRRACQDLKSWRERFPLARDLSMSVNVSRRLLVDPGLVGAFATTVREAGIDPAMLILELTESVACDQATDAVAVLTKFREAGFRIHLDDFGTGYSSLNCLSELPVNGLKIDRAFLAKACTRWKHAAVLGAIVSVAGAFELQVVAEGIENTEQLELLRSLDVELGQGYLFSAPVEPAGVEKLLQNEPSVCFS
ncbi:MAG: EAL domain-containing protein [Planctomycetota bacterium]